MITYTLKVIDIRKETEDTVTVCFKQPALKKVKYIAGQYLTLIFRINGRRYLRPYSFSSAPLVDSALEITIKRVPNGLVSNHIHDVLNIGDSVEVMSPMGDFIFDDHVPGIGQVFLWGVGSGITPLISIIKQVLSGPSDIKVNLVYGNRKQESTIFLELISNLLIKYPERFRVWHFYSQAWLAESSLNIIQGRIEQQYIVDILNGIQINESVHYICGPKGLKESVKEVLLDLHLSPEAIFSEDFELVRDAKDFEDIHTQVVDLKFNNQLYHLEVVKGKTVLESALEAGIELPYSCQTGSCSTCLGRINAGQLKMIGLTHERQDLKNNEYLLCCSHPLTGGVSIEV